MFIIHQHQTRVEMGVVGKGSQRDFRPERSVTLLSLGGSTDGIREEEADQGYRTLQQVRALGTASSGMWSNMGGCLQKNCKQTYSPWRPA